MPAARCRRLLRLRGRVTAATTPITRKWKPLNAIASVSPSGDSVEIWAGTQSQSIACEAPAKVLGIARDKVKLHDMLMGGGFGRRGNRDVDFIIDAVLLSKEAGRPVKVMWTRETTSTTAASVRSPLTI